MIDDNDLDLDENEHLSLCEALDRLLNKGAVVAGDLTISVANVDLLYLSLQVIVTSIETARQYMLGPESAGRVGGNLLGGLPR